MGYAQMATDELLEQKRKIEDELIERIDEEIKKIEERRAELMAMKPARLTVEVAKKKRGKSTLPPKYKNPLDPTQTWTGRGPAPKWLDRNNIDAYRIKEEG